MTKDGRFSYRQIFSYLADGQYPPGFSKADKLGLRKRAKFFEAKGSDLYYCGGGENVHILCLKYIKFNLHFNCTCAAIDNIVSKCTTYVETSCGRYGAAAENCIDYPRGWSFWDEKNV